MGCQILESNGHFLEFAHFIRQHGLEEEDIEIIAKLKAVLWAVVCIWKPYTRSSHSIQGRTLSVPGEHRRNAWWSDLPRRRRYYPSNCTDC